VLLLTYSATLLEVRDGRGGVAGDSGGDQSRRSGRPARRDLVAAAEYVPPQRPRSAVAAARDATGPILVRGDEMTAADSSYTVLVLGSQGVGKTTVTRQLLTSEYLANRDDTVGQSAWSAYVLQLHLRD